MKVTVILDHKFIRDQQGRVCAHTMFGDTFWERYLTTFDSVDAICRVRPMNSNDSPIPIENDRVRFLPVTYYEGPKEFARVAWRVRSELTQALSSAEAIVLRVPQILPTFAASMLRRRKHPYGVEVVGDPWDVYAPGAESNPLRPIFRRYFSRRLRTICRDAVASCYVTEYSLQRRYPPAPGTFSTFASSVQLEEVVEEARDAKSFSMNPCRLLIVGALNRLYKGQDLLIRAVSELVREGMSLSLRIVGDGQYRDQLEAMARELGAGESIEFVGTLPFGEKVFSEMDQADLFVLPSRQEGLARTVPESMSRGLPCISSDVGGMAEIVPEECLVVPGDLNSLKECIKKLSSSPERLAELSQQSLSTARQFLKTAIEPRRQAFMKELYRETDGSLSR